MAKLNRLQHVARRRRGLSLPEAMISLSITALLLVSVAAAFVSSAQAIEMNDGFFRSTQAARVSMNQILGEIRNCTDCQFLTGTTTLTITRPIPLTVGQSPYQRPANEATRQFAFDSTNNRLTLQIAYLDGTFSPLYELASNVTACSFGPVPAADMVTDWNGTVMPLHVPVQITVSTGGNTVVLNGSAAPRQALKY